MHVNCIYEQKLKITQIVMMRFVFIDWNEFLCRNYVYTSILKINY